MIDDLEATRSTAARSASRHWMLRALLGAGWAPASVLALHIYTSSVKFVYARFPHFDVALHLLGGAAIAFLFWRSAREAERARVVTELDPRVLALLVFGLTCAAAVFWEFAEFTCDRWFGQHLQSGLQDTIEDMFFGICGGVVFIVAVKLLARRAPV
jgi:hypothetical protein